MATHVNIGGNSNTTILSMASDDSTLNVTDVYESAPSNEVVVNNSLEQDLANLTKMVNDNTPTLDTEYLDKKLTNFIDKKINQPYGESTPAIAVGCSFAGKKFFKSKGSVQPGTKYPNIGTTHLVNEKSIINQSSGCRYFSSGLVMLLEDQGVLNSENNLNDHLDELKYNPETDRGNENNYFGVIRFYVSQKSGDPDPVLENVYGSTIIDDIDERMYFGGIVDGKGATSLPFSAYNQLYRIKNYQDIQNKDRFFDIYFKIVPANRNPTIGDAMLHQIRFRPSYFPRGTTMPLILGPENPSVNGGPQYSAVGKNIGEYFRYFNINYKEQYYSDGDPFNDTLKYTGNDSYDLEVDPIYEDLNRAYEQYDLLILSLLCKPFSTNAMKDNVGLSYLNSFSSCKLMNSQPGTVMEYNSGSMHLTLLLCTRAYNKLNNSYLDPQALLKKLLFDPLDMPDTSIYYTPEEYESKKDRIIQQGRSNNEYTKPLDENKPRWEVPNYRIVSTIEANDPNFVGSFGDLKVLTKNIPTKDTPETEQSCHASHWWSTISDAVNFFTFLTTGNDKNEKLMVSKRILIKYTRTTNNGYNLTDDNWYGQDTGTGTSLSGSASTSRSFTGFTGYGRGDGRVINVNDNNVSLDFNKFDPYELHVASASVGSKAQLIWGGGSGWNSYAVNFTDNTVVYTFSGANNIGRMAPLINQNLSEGDIGQYSLTRALSGYTMKYLRQSVRIPNSHLIGSQAANNLAFFETSVADAFSNVMQRVLDSNKNTEMMSDWHYNISIPLQSSALNFRGSGVDDVTTNNSAIFALEALSPEPADSNTLLQNTVVENLFNALPGVKVNRKQFVGCKNCVEYISINNIDTQLAAVIKASYGLSLSVYVNAYTYKLDLDTSSGKLGKQLVANGQASRLNAAITQYKVYGSSLSKQAFIDKLKAIVIPWSSLNNDEKSVFTTSYSNLIGSTYSTIEDVWNAVSGTAYKHYIHNGISSGLSNVSVSENNMIYKEFKSL